MNHSRLPDAKLIAEHQTTLLFKAERFFGGDPMPKEIRRAFMDTPRHLFAPRFFSSQNRSWIDLQTERLSDHLSEIYSDHPLCIYRDVNGRTLSTISQPSLVLYMLDLLELKPGLTVFELGGGSGWNAALLSRLVGPSGRVVSVEIIEDLVTNARSSLDALKLKNVDFQSGDASANFPEAFQYDRGIFTASAEELPVHFFEQIKADGLLIFVLKAQPNYDLLCLLKKTGHDTFTSELQFTCSFVPMTGISHKSEPRAQSLNQTEHPPLSQDINWSDIKIPDTAIVEFLEFAKLVFDCQQTYLLENETADFDEEFWGTFDQPSKSLLIFNEDRLLLYGSEEPLISLRRAAKRWQKAGQPSVDDLKLSIHKSGSDPDLNNDQWMVTRGQSCLIWGL